MHWFYVITTCLLFTNNAFSAATLKADAPETYVVQEGDTLWGIANKFLEDPSQWEHLWHNNAQRIGGDPNHIYPGDVLIFKTTGHQATIQKKPTVKLRPKIHSKTITKAISTIPLDHVQPFLSKSIVLPAQDMQIAPYIVAFDGGGPVGYKYTQIFVKGLPLRGKKMYDIIRPGQSFQSSHAKDILGVEGLYLGKAKLIKAGNPATLEIIESVRELEKGDRIVPAKPNPFQADFLPRPAPSGMKGQIISIKDNYHYIGKNHIVVIDKGKVDRIRRGDVLDICERGKLVEDPFHKQEMVQLPYKKIGKLMVFRPFDRVSYAMVLSSSRPITLHDMVSTPESRSTK